MPHLVLADEQPAVLAISKRTPATSPETVALLSAAGSARAILNGSALGLDEAENRLAEQLASTVADEDLAWAAEQINAAMSSDASLVTLFDALYPKNLHDIYDRPPFLFYRGSLLEEERRAVAVVGTRSASDEGKKRARRLAAELAEAGVTVVSGLAKGIDRQAHEGSLGAGGRTIAVFGTGINRVYPADHAHLAGAIARQGSVVSQFWPDSPPTRNTFPIRNVVTSGMAIGTVVVEAKGQSGSSQQARHCLRHGRQLFLLQSLVAQEPWAHSLAQRPGAHIVSRTEDVLQVLDNVESPLESLTAS